MTARPTTDELHHTIAGRLRGVDQRYTSSRRRLVDALDAADGPLSVADLLPLLGGLPQSSEYRNLADLVQAGVVGRVSTHDDLVRYELAEDLAGHHHHLVCTGCGQVVDVELSRQIEQAVRKVAQQIASAAGYRATGHRVDVLGLCDRCA
jgi:Fur family ferric uptake transcriptional regulator